MFDRCGSPPASPIMLMLMAMMGPRAKLLFRVEGIRSVFFGCDFTAEDAEWRIIKPKVLAVIMDFFESGISVVEGAKPNLDTKINYEDDEIVQMNKKLLDTRIHSMMQDVSMTAW
uniref:Nfu_N domain-containing protein n=1 Tax=Anopheles atroparvus TaxID=41427 RepID=A0A182IKY2_ANOAO